MDRATRNLAKYIKQKGIKASAISDETGISPGALYPSLSGGRPLRGLTRRYLSCVEMLGALFASGYVVSPDKTGKWFFGTDTKAPLFTEEATICEMPQGTDFRYWNAFHEAVAAGKMDREAFDGAWRAAIGGEAHASI